MFLYTFNAQKLKLNSHRYVQLGKTNQTQVQTAFPRGILGCWHSSSSITDNEKVFSSSHTSENKVGWYLFFVHVLHTKIMTIKNPLQQGFNCGLQE